MFIFLFLRRIWMRLNFFVNIDDSRFARARLSAVGLEIKSYHGDR